jgi:hypothetical protein
VTLEAHDNVAIRSVVVRVAIARVVASLRRCDGTAVAMASRADELLCNNGEPSRQLCCSATMASRADGYVALQRWWAEPTTTVLCNDGGPDRRLRCFAVMVGRTDNYATVQQWRVGPTAMLLCSDGGPNQRLRCSAAMAGRADDYTAL